MTSRQVDMADTHSIQRAGVSRGAWIGAAVCAVLAVVYPWAWLSWIGYQQLQVWPAAVVPFGLNRVLVVHLLAILPLAAWLASGVARIARQSPLVVPLAIAGGLVAAPSAWFLADLIAGELLFASATDHILPHVVRLGWSLLLVLPWAIAAVTLVWQSVAYRELVWVDGLIVVSLACLPVVYVEQLLQRQPIVVTDSINHEQFWTALKACRQLSSLCSPIEMSGYPLETWISRLEQRVAQTREQLAQPLASPAGDTERLERARLHHQLAEFERADALLQPLHGRVPLAEIQLGLSAEVQSQWAAAADHYGVALGLLTRAPTAPEEASLRLRRLALERRVNNLRRSGAARQAERELLAGLAQAGPIRDAYLLQLGYHYQMAGRVREARDYFQQAAEANPQLRERAEREISSMRDLAEGCLLRSVPGVTR